MEENLTEYAKRILRERLASKERLTHEEVWGEQDLKELRTAKAAEADATTISLEEFKKILSIKA